MESFFSLLPKNVLNRQRWDTREEVRLAIVTWIDRTYHRRQRQEALGRLTGIEFETIFKPTPQTQRPSEQQGQTEPWADPHDDSRPPRTAADRE